MVIIDSHIHCGVQNVSLPFDSIKPLLDDADINGACLFAPVEDIYHRYTSHFDDNTAWRECRVRAHDYLLNISKDNNRVYPYYFVWNDFSIDDLDERFLGIKWHHHDGEPVYNYSDPRCTEMIDTICKRNLPIVLEETFDRTIKFIEQIAGRTVIIIPHLGLLNGGFDNLLNAGIWNDDNVYADTALAGYRDISFFLENYGARRLLFGSDYPFGMPISQLYKLKDMGIDNKDLEMICSSNILRILGEE